MRAVTVGSPIAKGMCAIGCNGELLCSFYVSIHIKQGATNGALAMLLHTFIGTVCFNRCDRVAKSVGCCNLTVACLPSNEIGNFVCTFLIGIDMAARALIVLFPTVCGAGCCLTVHLFAITVRMRSSTVVGTSVADHIFCVIVDVCTFFILFATFTSFPVVVVILDPFAKGVSRGGDDKVFVINGIFTFVKILFANATLEVCLDTLCKSILGVGGRNFFNLNAVTMCAKVTVSGVTSGANCLCNTGCIAALTIIGFGVLVIA